MQNTIQPELPFDSTPELDELEAKVWAIIKVCKGREHAISVRTLLLMLKLNPNSRSDERRVRKVVERLVKVHGLPIGSSCDPRYHGFYHITDPNELKQHFDFLVRVAIRYLTRASRLKRGNLDRLVGQLELELKGGSNGDDGRD